REFDLNKAKALLAEAGWSDSDNNGILDQEIDGVKTELTLDVLAGTSQKVTELLANSLRESAEKIGIRLNIIPSDINRLSSDTRQGQYETALIGAALYPGLVELYQNYHSASLAPQGDNRSRFINPVADSLIEAIRTTENPQRRRQLYFAAQQLLHDETPDVFLYAPRQRYVASKRFRYVISSNRPGYYEQLFRLREPQN
ncbi:MAG: ABC transporter substrate-binding protein, partial [Saprospiraceae bacterium]